MTITLNALQKQRRDTASNWTSNNTVLLAGELGYESDTKKFKIGDGSTAWQSLDYIPIPDTNRLLTGNLTVGGNFTVNGTTTTIDTTTLTVEDKNIEIGKVTTPTDTTADGGGISLLGTTTKTINWVDSTDSWTLSEHLDLANGKVFKINNTEILSATTLGSSVVSSSLTSVGTIATGVWNATAISGSKVTPDFGSQNIVTTGSITGNDLEIDSGTLSVDASNNRVGIGTTSPAEELHIRGTSNVGIRLDDSGQSYGNIIYNNGSNSNDALTIAVDEGNTQASSTMRFRVDASEKMRIDSNGNVGLGTTSPNTKLHIFAPPLNTATLTTTNCLELGLWVKPDGTGSNTNGHIYTGITLADGFAGMYGVDAGASAANHLAFFTGSTSAVAERMRIDTSGNVGIGTTSPVEKLHVAGDLRVNGASGGTLILGGSSAHTSKFVIGSNAGNTNGNLIIEGGDGTDFIKINSAGKVGIGTDSPSSHLHVNSGTTNTAVTFESTDAEVNIHLKDTTGTAIIKARDDYRFENSTGELMRISSTGKVGIGTTNPATLLQLVGSSSSTASSGGTLGIRQKGDTNNDGITISSSHANSGRIYKDTNGALHIYNTGGNSNDFIITNSGNVGLGTDSIMGQLHIGSGTGGGNVPSNHEILFGANNSDITFLSANDSASVDGTIGAWNTAYNFQASKIVFDKNAANTGQLLFFTQNGTGIAERMRIDSAGNVSIGTTSPLTDAQLTISADAEPALAFQRSGSGRFDGGILLSSGHFFFKAGADSTTVASLNTVMKLESDGKLFVPEVHARTTSSAVNMRVDSDGEFRRSTSSKRYKKDITDATWGLAELLKLKPITYKSNATGKDADDKTYGGFTAEDVHDLGLTEFVDYNENNEPDALAYGNMVSICVKAIQELTARVAALEAA